jgi:replicative DNA helicase
LNADVLQLPRALPQVSELEARVVGAALDLGLLIADFEALGLAGEDFAGELHRKAWLIARKRAERREPVSAETVGSAGLRAKWFTDGQVQALIDLTHSNLLTRETFRHVAEDLRLMVRAGALATALEAQVRALRTGAFNPARTATALEALVDQLQRDTAPDEDASGDVLELQDGWDTAEKTGKSRLLPTRIAILDAEIGGLPPGLTVFASAPGVGKTAVLDSMIRAQLEADPELHLGFFGLEDGTSHIARRWMAADTGMLLREVGWAKRTPEQRDATERSAEAMHPLLRRLHVYRHDTITPSELVARAASMRVRHNVAGIYVDNLTEVDFANRGRTEQYHEAIGELGRRLRNFGMREQLPIGLIAHTVGTVRPGEIPTYSDLAGGQALARRARLFFGLWAKGEAIRCTTGKANELGPGGVTVEFARLKMAGLIDPREGAKVNLQAERAAERATKLDEKGAESERLRKKRLALRAADKATAEAAKLKPVEPEAQAALLLEVPSAE